MPIPTPLLAGNDGIHDPELPAVMRFLAKAVEAKDPCTRGHLERTRRYGLLLAAAVAPELAARPEVACGFFLHDLGKAGVREDLLGKPGPLDPEEWMAMREHPEIGAQILTLFRVPVGAAEIVRHHHERFDGTGYPAGLAGTRIPLPARIFAVADAFDAMTSDRPYRRAMPVERTLREIGEGAGTQFDPAIAEAFLTLMDGAGDPSRLLCAV
ncbi:MAG: HD-GYP domain-containing protein [Actinobacteria bacterium]|nr:HD-GYP domain-containing protein [Actinomycetota bacterium]